MEAEGLIVATCVFLLLAASATAAYYAAISARGALRMRLRRPPPRAIVARGLVREGSEPEGIPGKLVQWRVKRLRGELARKESPHHKLQNILAYAGWQGIEAVAAFQFLQAGLIAAGAVCGIVLAHALGKKPLLPGLCGALLGYAVPRYAVGKLASVRQMKIAHELPGALDLLVVTLEAGLGMVEALRLVGRESERRGTLLGHELSTVAAEIGAGVPVSDALRSLGERTGLDDLKALVAVLSQSEKMGGRLAPALRSAAELLSSRRRRKAEENAQKSSVKMLIPLVLFMLPAMMIVTVGPALIQVLDLIGKK